MSEGRIKITLELTPEEQLKVFETGYFGRPGSPAGKTHIVWRDGFRPVCGARQHAATTFQWCSAGIYLPYIECDACKRWYQQHHVEK